MRISIYRVRAACLAGLSLMVFCCQKTVSIKQVISMRASRTIVLADGVSLDTLYADLPVNTVATNRGVVFQATTGTFINGFDTMTVIANRTDLALGKITATAIWRASLRPGGDTIFVSTYTVPQYTDHLLLNLDTVFADSIQLIPSSYTLKDTFGMQITILGKLFSNLGGMVSQGMNVQFTDFSDANTPVGGVFMPQSAVIIGSGVSTIYFPPLLPRGSTSGMFINIRASAFGAGGVPIGSSGSARIFISP